MTKPPYVPGYGPTNAKVCIVGMAPGGQEEIAGRPLIGPSGQMLDQYLGYAYDQTGISKSEPYKTNVSKYRPPMDKMENLKIIGVDLQDEIGKLRQEIHQLQPNVIIALGNEAMHALTGKLGIKKWAGSILSTVIQGKIIKVVPTYHPAHLLREGGPDAARYSDRTIWLLDLKKAVQESLYPRLELPVRNLQSAKSSLDVYRFLKQYGDCLEVSIDIEVIKSIPTCIGLAFNAHHALSIPLIDLSVYTSETGMSLPERRECYKLIAGMFRRPGLRIVGQNFKFDHEKLLKPLGFRLPEDVYIDTMLLAHTIQPEFEVKLAFLARVYTREPYWKDEFKEFNPKKDKIDQVFLYNAKDAAVTFEIAQILKKEAQDAGLWNFYYDYVRHMHQLYMRIESEGLLVDPARRKELREKYESLTEVAQKQLDAIFNRKVNANSPQQILGCLAELGLPPRGGTDEDTLVAIQANHCEKKPQASEAINHILNLRRYRKTIGTYLDAEPDYDGRMRCSYRIVGTETGRTSTSIMKSPVRPTKVGMAFQTMTKHGDIGAELREIFIADPGYVFLEADLSQAEPRIVARLCDDEELLAAFGTIDIHSTTASWIFKKPPAQINKKTERFIGKVTRNGGNYDMGKRRHMLDVNSSIKRFHIPMEPISEWRAGENLKTFHGYSPRVRGVFHADVEKSLRDFRTLINPFGRKRTFFARMDHDIFKEGYAWIPQSTVRDQMGYAILRILDRLPSLRIVLEAHDAIVCLVPESERDIRRAAEVISQEMSRPIDFSRCTLSRGSLTIPAELKIGTNYRDLKDYHLET